MSKILVASANAQGKVTCEGVLIPEAVILTAGKQASTGLLYIEGEKAYYIPPITSDIASTIDKTAKALEDIVEAIQKIASTLTSIGGGMSGSTTAPPPTLAADVTIINNKASEISALKSELDTLKGALK